MAGGGEQFWDMASAWHTATEIVGAFYGVAAQDMRAASRGRGPRPPAAIWIPKKIAVSLTVILCGCDYSALARQIGLSKDTVASHCAAVRQAVFDDPALGQQLEAMRVAATVRGQLLCGPVQPVTPRPDYGSPAGRLTALHLAMNRAIADARRGLSSDELKSSSDDFSPSSDEHAIVISALGTGK